MKITFFSTYLNHHQLPLCQALNELTNHDFYYVATNRISQARLNLGYKDMDYDFPFVVRAYENIESMKKAEELALDSDVAIFGFAPESFVAIRMKTNKLTFRYSERIYKTGIWKLLSPRGLMYMLKNHTQYHSKQLYMLCASAYTAYDFNLVGAYKGKTYKWGYFPEVKEVDIDKLFLDKKKNAKQRLLWVSRFIELKHPETVIMLSDKLRDNGYDFELHMIGNGPLEDKIKDTVAEKHLYDYVFFHGAISPCQVREQMEKSDIFLFTSDFNEGWGVVLNESMNAGCAVIASHAIGSVAFLVQDGINGYIYKNNCFESLYEKTIALLNNPLLREQMGKKAYRTITQLWNARTAAERFIVLCNNLKSGKNQTPFDDGPCSRAEIISNWWYK